MLHPSDFLFFCTTNVTNLERLHRMPVVPSLAIFFLLDYCSLLFRASSLPLQVIFTFSLSFYDHALRLPSSFCILGLVEHKIKSKLSNFFLINFMSTHPLMLSPSTSGDVTHFFILCFCSGPPFLVKMLLLSTLTFADHNLVIWAELFHKLLVKDDMTSLPAAHDVALKSPFLFVRHSLFQFFTGDSSALLQALYCSQHYQQVCHVYSFTFLFCCYNAFFISTYSFFSYTLACLTGTFCPLILQ